MFLRSKRRVKDGKDHRYFSVVENRRLNSGKVAQRTVLYLVFDESAQRFSTLSLFPGDRQIPADALDSVQGEAGAGWNCGIRARSAIAGSAASCGGNWA